MDVKASHTYIVSGVGGVVAGGIIGYLYYDRFGTEGAIASVILGVLFCIAFIGMPVTGYLGGMDGVFKVIWLVVGTIYAVAVIHAIYDLTWLFGVFLIALIVMAVLAAMAQGMK